MATAPYRINEKRRWMGGGGTNLFAASAPTNRRRYIPKTAQDTRANLSDWGWTELVSASRWLCANFPQIQSAVLSMAQYAVGNSWKVQFTGKDKAWGAKMEEAIAEWDKVAEIRGHDFRTFLTLAAVSMIRDGDANFVLCDTGTGWPKLQLVPAHRVKWCGTDGKIADGPYAGMNVQNGVIMDAFGRPVAYRLSADGETFTDISADNFQQTFRPEFCDQARGIPWLSSAVNDLMDVNSIREYTLLGLKGVASKVMIHHTDNGQAPDPTSGGATYRGDETLAAEKLEGGTIQYFRAGTDEKIEIPNDQRPSANAQEFSFSVLKGAFESLGWPVELFDPSRLGGAPIRLRVAQAKRTVEMIQGLLDVAAKRAHGFAIAKLIKLGALEPNAEWWKFEHQMPRSITVDNGRDSKAEIEALNNGAGTFADYFGSDGQNWQEQFDQRIAEQKYLQDGCAKAGVKVEDIRASVLTKQDPQAAAQAPDIED